MHMNSVEFLIQKEGDLAWLPLESPTVEVLEGRYHLVAKSNPKQDAPAQIQIRHRYTDDGVLQEELEQKLLRPDEQGHFQILSSVYLGYGLWTISCTPIAESSNFDPAVVTSAAINLQVLEEDFDLISDWEFTETSELFGDELLGISNDSLASAAVAIEASLDLDDVAFNLATPLIATVDEFVDEGDNQTVPVQSIVSEADVEPEAIERSASVVLDTASLPQDQTEARTWARPEVRSHPMLPILPQTLKEITLRPVSPSQLPPELPVPGDHSPASPQLPTFAACKLPWRDIPFEQLSATWQAQAHKQGPDSNRAFAALKLQQRFCQSLRHLATLHRHHTQHRESTNTAMLFEQSALAPQAAG